MGPWRSLGAAWEQPGSTWGSLEQPGSSWEQPGAVWERFGSSKMLLRCLQDAPRPPSWPPRPPTRASDPQQTCKNLLFSQHFCKIDKILLSCFRDRQLGPKASQVGLKMLPSWLQDRHLGLQDCPSWPQDPPSWPPRPPKLASRSSKIVEFPPTWLPGPATWP